jgi:menaquinone-specific isochorismate synthase
MTASLATLTTLLDPTLLGPPYANAARAGTTSSQPLDFLLDVPDAYCWIRRGEGLVAFGSALSFRSTGPERFAAAEEWWKRQLTGAQVTDDVRLPGTGLLAFGSFAFSKTSGHPSQLDIPHLVVGYADGHLWLTLIRKDGTTPTTAEAHAVLQDLLASAGGPANGEAANRGGPANGEANRGEVAEDNQPAGSSGQIRGGSLDEQEWMRAVAAGVQAIEGGELQKVVLARDIVAAFDSPVSRPRILRNLADRYSECWTYGVGNLVGSTPEILIKVDGTTAQARVLAGTLDRKTAPDNDDGYARSVLAGSQKQRQEHEFAVRSLTRQLAPFATDLSFPAEPFILELPNVWHLASDVLAELAGVEGHLPTPLALVEALHPTAAVCGTPRTEAGELIRRLEKLDRGPYAGPVGWLDGAGNGEWGIALRGAVIEDQTTVRLYAGCGIVEASDPAAELAETWAKFRPMLQALGLQP